MVHLLALRRARLHGVDRALAHSEANFPLDIAAKLSIVSSSTRPEIFPVYFFIARLR
jgi:hypothetical protein